jgi:Raf kinase inhibitor-like YbhB/YbcL family protein
MTMQLRSDAFTPDGELPRRFTRDGEDVSPPVRWDRVPDETRSLALAMEDVDAGAPVTHWLLYDLPADLHGLLQGPAGAGKLGRNDFAREAYCGSCPPPAQPRRYRLQLYALDVDSLELPAGATRAAMESACRPHILAAAEVSCWYCAASC